MAALAYLRRFIRRLGPYPSLAVLALPLAMIEPMKLVALVVFGAGHWLTGSLVMAGAYALSILFVERLFKLVKPKLLKLPWFAALWRRFVDARQKLLSWLRATSIGAAAKGRRRLSQAKQGAPHASRRPDAP